MRTSSQVDPKTEVDDPVDAFKYDEYGCLVSLTPEAFDYFMFAPASKARIEEASCVPTRWRGCVLDVVDHPTEAGEVRAIWRLARPPELTPDVVDAAILKFDAALLQPISQLAMMRRVSELKSAVARYVAERIRIHRASKYLQF